MLSLEDLASNRRSPSNATVNIYSQCVVAMGKNEGLREAVS